MEPVGCGNDPVAAGEMVQQVVFEFLTEFSAENIFRGEGWEGGERAVLLWGVSTVPGGKTHIVHTQADQEHHPHGDKGLEEYGIFQNGDFSCPLGKGERIFRSEKAKEAFKQKYYDMMSIYKK